MPRSYGLGTPAAIVRGTPSISHGDNIIQSASPITDQLRTLQVFLELHAFDT